MSDIWLALAAEEAPASSSSSSSRPLSDRAAARASRPRPWLQSQGPTPSTTSKPRSTPAASTATPVAGLAAGRKLPAAQAAPLAEARRRVANICPDRKRRIRTEKLLLQLDRCLPDSQSPPAEAAPLDSFWAGPLAKHARHVKMNPSRIPAPMGSTLAQERKSMCPCGRELCVFRQQCELSSAREAAYIEQLAAAGRERIAAREEELRALFNRPRGFHRRMAKLEALANDLAQQRNRLRISEGQKAARTGESKWFTSRRSKQAVVQPTVPSQPRGILRMPGQKNKVAKTVSFSHFECKEVERWIGDLDVATGTPADQCVTDDGAPFADSRYIHVHVARPSSPRPASQARFDFGAAYPLGMVMRGWTCVDEEEKLYGRTWRG